MEHAPLIRGGQEEKSKLLIVGDGSKRFQAALHQQVEDYGLTRQVKFVGYLENPMRIICRADVILMCSHWELGRATVEAMLAGKPVIGTANSGGTEELIQDGKMGLLYKAGNHDGLLTRYSFYMKTLQKNRSWVSPPPPLGSGRFTQERYAKETLTC